MCHSLITRALRVCTNTTRRLDLAYRRLSGTQLLLPPLPLPPPLLLLHLCTVVDIDTCLVTHQRQIVRRAYLSMSVPIVYVYVPAKLQRPILCEVSSSQTERSLRTPGLSLTYSFVTFMHQQEDQPE